MLFIPVRDAYYMDAILETGDCKDNTRVLAWVNYMKEIGIKRYYMIEKYPEGWYRMTIDVYPEDRTIFWNTVSSGAFDRDLYIDSVYMFDDDSVVIHIDSLQSRELGEV